MTSGPPAEQPLENADGPHLRVDGHAARQARSRAHGGHRAARGNRTGAGRQGGAVDFGSLLKSNIDRVDQALKGADTLAARFQMGDAAVSLEDSMVAMQKANVTFQAALQVRNKVVSAYQDIMNLPI